ncbi:transglycosylase domain-containing protein [Fundicoccus sp. Sow4_H7]|uniref:transglycosylase domain-containing protein n=1 Tax=Fundicoccus sp. Sow4_H7 TaxID=3438784 RepID=UPI003F8EEE6E
MTKDNHKNNPDTRKQTSDSNYYDVSFDYPGNTNQEGHSDRLESPKEPATISTSFKWDNFYDEFKEKQEQEYQVSQKQSQAVVGEDKHRQENSSKKEDVKLSQKVSRSLPPRDTANKININQSKKDLAAEEKLTNQNRQKNEQNQASRPLPKMTPKTSVMLDRSIRHARKLFNSLIEENTTPTHNPYKDDVVDDYFKRKEDEATYLQNLKNEEHKHRLDEFIKQSSSFSNQYQKDKAETADTEKTKVTSTEQAATVDRKEKEIRHDTIKERSITRSGPAADEATQEFAAATEATKQVKQIKQLLKVDSTDSVDNSSKEERFSQPMIESAKDSKKTEQVSSPPKNIEQSSKRKADLPSPEDIAFERERRRKARIAQLENLHSEEDIKRTYQSNFRKEALSNEKQSAAKQKQVDQPLILNEDDLETTKVIPAISHEAETANDDKHATTKIISRKALTRKGKLTDNTVYLDTSELKEAMLASTKNISKKINNSAEEAIIDSEPALRSESVKALPSPNRFKFWPFKRRVTHSDDVMVTQAKAIVTEKSSDNIVDISSKDAQISDTTATVTPLIVEVPQTGEPVSAQDVVVASAKNEDLSFNGSSIINATDQDQTILSAKEKEKLKKKEEKKERYSLSHLDGKEKAIFSFNVFFNVLRRLAFYLVLLLLFAGAGAVGAAAGYFAYLVSNTTPPTETEMAEDLHRLEQQSVLYYGNGEPIASIRSDVVRTAVELEDISPYIIDGLIATEDEHFYEHPGIMPKAIIRAALQEVLAPGTGTGGSTLTQQLVKQQMLSHDVTFFRKANEILLSLRLENYFDKDEILAAYLNVSPFGRNNNGDNVAGIDKASEGIFGINPDEVNLPQAAFLIGLPQDPYNYTPYDQYGTIRDNLQAGIDRMHEVLFRMYRDQKISKAQYEEAMAYDITKDFLPTEPREEERQTYLYQAIMNGAIEQLMRLNVQDDSAIWNDVNADVDRYNEYYLEAEEQLRTGGYRVYSTIDREIYDQLQISAQEYINDVAVSYDGVYEDPETGEQTYYIEDIQNGLVVIDNKTGRVLGFVAGTDYENNQIDHAFGMHRSPGSTIKPLAVYGPAIQHNIITPASVIPDTAYEVTYPDGSIWTPTNYGSVVSGETMTARTALYRSDNIPAVRIYEELLNRGIPIIDYLNRMGFDTVDSYTETDTQNLSFSLGGVSNGPTVFEETRAFTTFANNGQYIDGYYIERIEDSYGNIVYQHDNEPIEVFSEDTNYLIVDMLRDTNVEGTGRTAGSEMAMGGDWIAKSGISEYSKDVWYIASTPAITIGSWIGYDSRYYEYTIDVNDGYDRESVRSQRYWARVVNDLYALRPEIFGVDQSFQQPASVQEQTILSRTGTLPGNITVGGVSLNISQPVTTELFKTSSPAPNLEYNFMIGGNDETHANFWNSYIAEERERQRQESIQRQQQNSSSSNENGESSSSDETSSNSEDETSPDESQTEETPPQ